MSVNSQPAYDAVAIDLTTADDPLTTRGICDAVYVGGTGGTVVLVTRGNRTVTFTGLAAGSVLPVGAKSIVKVGTTATGLVALYTGV